MISVLKKLAACALLFVVLAQGSYAQQSIDTSHVLRCTPQQLSVGDYTLVTRAGTTCNAIWGAVSVPIATLSSNGIGRPDGTTISINANGQYSTVAAPDSIDIGNVTITNPHISSQLTSGLYTPNTNVIGVQLNGIKNSQWNTLALGVDYFSFTPGKSGTPPKLTVDGATANQGLNITATGSGAVTVNGVGFSSGQVISSGTWNGSAIDIAHGGLGLTATPATGKILTGNAGAYMLATLTGANGLVVTTSAGNSTVTLTQGGGSSVTVNSGTTSQVAYYSGTNAVSPAPWLTLTTSAVAVAGTLAVTGAITPSQSAGLVGTTTSNNANAGSYGEYLSSTVTSGGAVSLTSTTAANVTSLSLTPGDWEVYINASFVGGTLTTVLSGIAGISTTSATLDFTTPGKYSVFPAANSTIFQSSESLNVLVGPYRLSLSTTTTTYFVCRGDFSTSTMSCYGILSARRMR